MPKLKHDVTLDLWGSTVTLPKGTAMVLVKGAGGTAPADLYAVESTKLLVDLTGNAHDPKYRYAFVDAEHVEDGDQ